MNPWERANSTFAGVYGPNTPRRGFHSECFFRVWAPRVAAAASVPTNVRLVIVTVYAKRRSELVPIHFAAETAALLNAAGFNVSASMAGSRGCIPAS